MWRDEKSSPGLAEGEMKGGVQVEMHMRSLGSQFIESEEQQLPGPGQSGTGGAEFQCEMMESSGGG